MRASITLIVVLASQLADQKQHKSYRTLRMVDLGNDGVMRQIALSVHRCLAPERVQEVEMAERVDAVALNHSAAHALKNIIEQTADPARAKCHAGLPIGPPPVEGDVEGTDKDVLVAENDKFVMHVRRDLDHRIFGRAEAPKQVDSRSFEPGVVVAVGQGHLTPVDDTLDLHAAPMSVDEVVGKIGIVDAVDANLDLQMLVPPHLLPANRRIDPVVDVRLGMKRVIGLTLGELWRQIQRFEVVVAPVHVPLQFRRVEFPGAVMVGGCPFPPDAPAMVLLINL
jgi:hypothetical protein